MLGGSQLPSVSGPANGSSTCAASGCGVTCIAPFLDCNKKDDDGCEVDPRSDPANCGSCGNPCSGGTPYCVNGACSANCPFTLCGPACVDTQTSLGNCNGCGNACPQPANGNGTPSCVAGKCNYACAVGYADCNTDAGDGCETFVKGNNVSRCGSCSPCAAPTTPHTRASCSAGVCGTSCDNAYVDCNRVAADGCECHVGGGIGCRYDKTCGACTSQGGACSVDTDCCSGGKCLLNLCTFDN
jgi:hypothetical protein